MNKEDVIRMVREAGFLVDNDAFQGGVKLFEHFAALVYAEAHQHGLDDFEATVLPVAIAAEREACAKVCEAYTDNDGGKFIDHEGHGYECAAAIRARGQA